MYTNVNTFLLKGYFMDFGGFGAAEWTTVLGLISFFVVGFHPIIRMRN